MADATPATAAEEWRAHWTLVLAGLLGFSLSAIAILSLGAFTEPLEKEFGWSRADVSSGFTLFSIVGVVLSPIFGNLVDRWGPRRLGVPGVMLVGVGFALFGTATGSLVNWLILWVIFGVCVQTARTTIWTASVSSQFKKSRGLALAVTLAGSGVGSIISPNYAGFLIDQFGWRLAYAIMGLSWGGVVCIVCYFFLYGRTDRRRDAPAAERVATASLPGLTIREGLLSPAFFKLSVAALCANMLIVALSANLIPLLDASGLTRLEAIRVASSIGVATIAGKMICGVLVDRMRGNYIAAIFISLPVITCAMLLSPTDSVVLRLIAVGALGLQVGAQVHMQAYLATRYFGLRAYGTIFGIFGSIIMIAVGLGAWVAARAYDLTGGYDPVLIAGIPASLLGALMLMLLGRYPDFETPEPVQR